MKKNRLPGFADREGTGGAEYHRVNNNRNTRSYRKASDIRIISNEDIMAYSRRVDRLFSLLNEDEASLLARSKIAACVKISAAQWTEEKLIDMISQNLAEVRIRVEHKGETLLIPKYSEEVIDLAPKLVVYKPTPELTIYLSDLNPLILEKLYKLDKKSRKYVILSAGKRLFKLFFPYYYNMVADLIKVRTER